MVRSPDGETYFSNIDAGILQGDAFAPFLYTAETIHIEYE